MSGGEEMEERKGEGLMQKKDFNEKQVELLY